MCAHCPSRQHEEEEDDDEVYCLQQHWRPHSAKQEKAQEKDEEEMARERKSHSMSWTGRKPLTTTRRRGTEQECQSKRLQQPEQQPKLKKNLEIIR